MDPRKMAKFSSGSTATTASAPPPTRAPAPAQAAAAAVVPPAMTPPPGPPPCAPGAAQVAAPAAITADSFKHKHGPNSKELRERLAQYMKKRLKHKLTLPQLPRRHHPAHRPHRHHPPHRTHQMIGDPIGGPKTMINGRQNRATSQNKQQCQVGRDQAAPVAVL